MIVKKIGWKLKVKQTYTLGLVVLQVKHKSCGEPKHPSYKGKG